MISRQHARHRVAVDVAAELAASDPADDQVAVDAAILVVHSLEPLGRDPTLTPDGQSAAAAEYRAAALVHLEQAVRRGCRDRSALEAEHFQVLRAEPAYALLLEGLPRD